LEIYQLNILGRKKKCMFENIRGLIIINLWDLFYWGAFDI